MNVRCGARLPLALLIFALPVLWRDASAQIEPEPFEFLDLRLGLSRNVSSDDLLSFWNPGLSVSANASTPFYAGSINAGLRYEAFSGRTNSLPSFKSAFFALGWGYRWNGQQHSVHEVGTEIGNFYMVFDEDTFSGSRKESELGLGFYYRIQMRISDGLGVFIQGSYTNVLTKDRLNLYHVSTGIVIRAETPLWIKTLLE